MSHLLLVVSVTLLASASKHGRQARGGKFLLVTTLTEEQPFLWCAVLLSVYTAIVMSGAAVRQQADIRLACTYVDSTDTLPLK